MATKKTTTPKKPASAKKSAAAAATPVAATPVASPAPVASPEPVAAPAAPAPTAPVAAPAPEPPAATPAAAPAAPAASATPAAPASAPASGIVEEVTLNWTDLTGKKTGATTFGSNKFYKAQIVTNPSGGFTVTFNYGRVGQAGQTDVKNVATLDAAQRAMNAKVAEKVKKGYVKIDLRTEIEERQKAQQKGVVAGTAKPKKQGSGRQFHPDVESLVRLMYTATGEAVAKGLSASAGASQDAPLGNLSDTQLDKGADILDEIDKLLKGGKKVGKDDLVDLTNSYLSNIPRNIEHARKGSKLDLNAILINSDDRLREQRQFITLLRDAYLQKDVFAEAAEYEDPMEVWYDGLKCDIEAVDAGSDEYKSVKKYFEKGQSPKNNLHGMVKLLRVWRLEQQGRKPAFDAYAQTVIHKPGASGLTKAWHGTKNENLMGIAKTGLVMPDNLPKGVYVTGHVFGRGIYHAPCWEDSGEHRSDKKGTKYPVYNGALKSMNYTSIKGAYYHAGNTSKTGFLFMEELALGVPDMVTAACHGKPAPEPGADYIYANAAYVGTLAHDEVVTFSESASRRTHVLEIGLK